MSTEINLDFSDLQPIEIPFEYNGKKYILREASGAVAKRFNNERTNRVKYGLTGRAESFRDIADLAPLLVSLCVTTESGQAIPQTVIETWNDKVIQRLFKTAKEISFLEDKVFDAGTVVESLLKEASCPINADEFRAWVLTLSDEKYGLVQKRLKETSVKE